MRFQPAPFLAFTALLLLTACGGQNSASLRSGGANRSAYGYAPPGPPSDPWGPYIREASQKYDVPERWIREVIRVESGGRMTMNGTPITSGAGAMGLMQVMPGTYAELRDRYDLGPDAYNPHDNIMAGTAYIRELYNQYGSPGFLAAYNGGPRRLENYLYGNRGLPTETRNYVAKIAPYIADAHPVNRAAPEVYAAAALPVNIAPGPRRNSEFMVARNAGRPASLALASNSAPAPISYRMSAPSVQVAALSQPAAPAQDSAPAPISYRMSAPPVQVAQATPEPAAPAPVSYRMSSPPPVEVAEAAPAHDNTPAPISYRMSSPPPVQVAEAEPAATPARVPFGRGAVPVGSSPFRLISSAQASTTAAPARTTTSASGAWAVQVGAFASESQARGATGRAQSSAQELSRARTLVTAVQQGRSTLYRARLAGLSREAATAACERLSRARSTCVVLSPDAQG